ncbi:hypothetical protein [Amycolatopsis camponoti]|nr:hypothetical protein [Amycolatopsis camponoti]
MSSEVGPKGLTATLISPGCIAETEFFRGKLTDQTLHVDGGAHTTC